MAFVEREVGGEPALRRVPRALDAERRFTGERRLVAFDLKSVTRPGPAQKQLTAEEREPGAERGPTAELI